MPLSDARPTATRSSEPRFPKGVPNTHTETLVGYILEVDKKIEEMNSLRLPALQRALDAAAGLFGMRRRS